MNTKIVVVIEAEGQATAPDFQRIMMWLSNAFGQIPVEIQTGGEPIDTVGSLVLHVGLR